MKNTINNRSARYSQNLSVSVLTIAMAAATEAAVLEEVVITAQKRTEPAGCGCVGHRIFG